MGVDAEHLPIGYVDVNLTDIADEGPRLIHNLEFQEIIQPQGAGSRRTVAINLRHLATLHRDRVLTDIANQWKGHDETLALIAALQRDHTGGNDLGSLLGSLLGGGGGAGGGQPDGAAILGHIFGGSQQRAEAGLGQATGLGANAGQLLQMLAPIVMSFLAQRMSSGGMNAGGLGQVLGQEHARVQQQGGLGGGLLGSLLDQDGDGQVGLSDLLKIGGGLLGLEAAGALRKLGADTTVVDPAAVWQHKGPTAPGAIDPRVRPGVLDAMGVHRQLMFPTSIAHCGAFIRTYPEGAGQFDGLTHDRRGLAAALSGDSQCDRAPRHRPWGDSGGARAAAMRPGAVGGVCAHHDRRRGRVVRGDRTREGPLGAHAPDRQGAEGGECARSPQPREDKGDSIRIAWRCRMMLARKIAVVTGGAQGIGREIALLFAREGADVALIDRDAEALEKTRVEVEGLGRRALALAAAPASAASTSWYSVTCWRAA